MKEVLSIGGPSKVKKILTDWDESNAKAFDAIKDMVEQETAQTTLKEIIEEDIKKTMSKDLNNLSNWYPAIKDCGIQVPDTLIFEVPEHVTRAFWMERQDEDRAIVADWLKDIYPQIKEMAHPYVFLKNGNFSNKFEAKDCIARAFTLGQVVEAVININYTSMMFGAGGVNELVVREFIGFNQHEIPCIYDGLPFRPEYRVFYDFDKHEVLYSVNYWDWDYCYKRISDNATDKLIFERFYPVIEHQFKWFQQDVENLVAEAMKDVTGLSGQWSVDIMQKSIDNNTDTIVPMLNPDNYWLIDMAIAQNSAYWRG